MSLDFLAPDQARPHGGVPPTMRSPIEWVHRSAGAKLVELAGWSVVGSYGAVAGESAACRDAVGLADLSHLGKLELQGEPGVLSSILSDLGGGAVPELGHSRLHDEIRWCPITAGRVLALSPQERTAELRQELEAAAGSAGSFAAVTELTSALGSNAVLGPLARETFARTTALDLRPERFGEGAFAPVSVARTPAMVLRQGGECYLHLFGAGYASYVWTVFLDAAQDLGGRAVGVEALRASIGEGAGAGA